MDENLISLRRWAIGILVVVIGLCLDLWMKVPYGPRPTALAFAQLLMFLTGVYMGTNYGRRVERHAVNLEEQEEQENE